MKARCDIVIPVHNRRDVTLACLRRLRDQNDLAWAVPIVVDDGSTDGTSEAVRAEFPSAEIVRGDGHLFWTGAVAQGMQHALARQTDFIFWLNDDCEPQPGALALLREAAAKSGGAAGGVCILPHDGTPIYGGFRKRGVELDFIGAQPGETIACDALNGNLVCFTRAAAAACGLPDARHLPHAFGDTDYTLRLRQRGFPVELVGCARAIATPNQPANHASWLVGDIGPVALWRGLAQKKSYAYLPANARFLWRHCGWRGGLHCVWLILKRVPITLLMVTTPLRWRRTWWGQSRRDRRHLHQNPPPPRA